MQILAMIFPITVGGFFLIGGGFLMGQGKYLVGVITILGGLWVVPVVMKLLPKAQSLLASL